MVEYSGRKFMNAYVRYILAQTQISGMCMAWLLTHLKVGNPGTVGAYWHMIGSFPWHPL
jgi:hypothetical protein